MQKIFSREICFKDDNGNDYPDWEEKRLGDIGSFFSGGTPTSTNKEYYRGDISFIKSGEIHNERTEHFICEEALYNSSAKIVNKGDLLYALYGATAGEVAISKIDGAINQAVLCIRSKVRTAFLYYYLLMKKKQLLSKYLQGGQGNLSANIVKSLKIPLPSEIEQKKISEFLLKIDSKIEEMKIRISRTQQFKKGLLQQMFV